MYIGPLPPSNEFNNYEQTLPGRVRQTASLHWLNKNPNIAAKMKKRLSNTL
jgi:hypothetical protein